MGDLTLEVPTRSGITCFAESIDCRPAVGTAVGKLLMGGGLSTYEPETIAACLALIEVDGIERFADVGANFGLYSLVVKAVFGDRVSIDAFEPSPELAELADTLGSLNNLPFRVHRLALGNNEGEAIFYLSDRSDASNSLNGRFRPSSRQITVKTDTLDAFYSKTPVPGLIKVDTETTEPDVLAGGLNLLSEAAPYVICEVLHGRGEDRLNQILVQSGYSAYQLTGEPIHTPRPIVGDPEHKHRDWLFSAKPPGAAFNFAYQAWLGALYNVT